MLKYLPSVFLSRQNFIALSQNFSSLSIPYSKKSLRLSHFFSSSSRSFLKISSSLSATFLVM